MTATWEPPGGTWEPPGGGWWQLEEVHVRGWQPRVFQERAPEAFERGFRRSAERYGAARSTTSTCAS